MVLATCHHACRRSRSTGGPAAWDVGIMLGQDGSCVDQKNPVKPTQQKQRDVPSLFSLSFMALGRVLDQFVHVSGLHRVLWELVHLSCLLEPLIDRCHAVCQHACVHAMGTGLHAQHGLLKQHRPSYHRQHMPHVSCSCRLDMATSSTASSHLTCAQACWHLCAEGACLMMLCCTASLMTAGPLWT